MPTRFAAATASCRSATRCSSSGRRLDPHRSVKLTVDVEARDGAARVGQVRTPRGSFPVPCFMPVGTRGVVKTLSSQDLEQLGATVILGNAYHLMLRPGAEVIE